MSASIVVAIIAAIAALAGTAISFFLTKAKEREATWRSQKLDHYKAFMAGLNAMVGPPASVEDRVRFADAANNIFLVGSREVLMALRGFLDETADSNPHRDTARHDRLLTDLVVAIRKDIGLSDAEMPEGYLFHLWAGKPLTSD
jgi:hypothetical protein